MSLTTGEESHFIKSFQHENETGDAVLTVYTIFPGIQVVYNSVHMDHLDLTQKNQRGKFIVIQHCQEGRLEQENDGDFFYLMPGDLAISKKEQMAQCYNYPLHHYHGITIAIDTEIAPKCFSEFMADVKVQPLAIAERFCGDRNSAILRSDEYIAHVFSEIYTMREDLRLGFLKIKLLELLYILNVIEPPVSDTPNHSLSRIQVNLAKAAAVYISEHMDRRVTIAELAKQFSVSDAYLKAVFKGVYGVPIFSYIRIQKMQCAAQELMKTDRPIADIAYEFGYNNESKFSAAFKAIMGDTPGVWRKMHSKINIV